MTEGLKSVAKGHQMNRIKKCQIAPEEADVQLILDDIMVFPLLSSQGKPKVSRRNKENIVFTSKIYFDFYCSYLFVSIMTEVTDKL